MVRTIVSLDDDDKAWLDRAARSQRVPMTKLVRHAIRRLRQEQEAAPQGFERLLRETAGTWKAGDGLAYQRLLRADAAIADSAAALCVASTAGSCPMRFRRRSPSATA